MPRSARASAGGYCYHVINRGNARSEVFHKEQDLAVFIGIMGEACIRLPIRVLAYCLMPNHFHLVLWPHADGDQSRWMHWLLTTHVRRYLVNTPMTESEAAAIRLSLRRARPYGTESWTMETARALGLEYSIRGRGRQPRLLATARGQ